MKPFKEFVIYLLATARPRGSCFLFTSCKRVSPMEFSSATAICLHLISSAIQRCRLSDELCRLSVSLKCSPPSDPRVLQISISDTGIGSCLEEFQRLKFSREGTGAEKWGKCDDEVNHYQLNLKESASAGRLTRLPSNPKNGLKFSGTEVFLSIFETVDILVAEINCFFQKMLMLKIPNVAYELVVERGDAYGLRDERVFLVDESNPLPFSASNLECLKSGLEDYVLKHGNSSNKKCGLCFPSVEHLKVGSGTVYCAEGHKNIAWVMEVVIVISEISEQTSSCFSACCAKSEVFYFEDFSPCSISQSTIKTLTSIGWKTYGLTLGSIVNKGSHALLEWEGLAAYTCIAIGIHCYQKHKAMIPSTRQKAPLDRNLMKRVVKRALDDLKEKHAGVLLSAHAIKICSYAPDLARAIAGLVLSSNDSGFQEECFSLLGLQCQGVGGKIVEDCIKEKIISVIEINDRKPHQRGEEVVAPFLFKDDCLHNLEFQEEEYEEGEDAFSHLDI